MRTLAKLDRSYFLVFLLLGGTTKGTLPTETSAGNQDAFVMALPL